MSNSKKPTHASPLDEQTLGLLGENQATVDVPQDRLDKVFSTVLGRINAEELAKQSDFITVRADSAWQQIAPLIEKKVLYLDEKTGTESYLLRAEAGAETPAHDHDKHELCLVLEGDITYDDLTLYAGDYHFAAMGTAHSTARTSQGTVCFFHVHA